MFAPELAAAGSLPAAPAFVYLPHPLNPSQSKHKLSSPLTTETVWQDNSRFLSTFVTLVILVTLFLTRSSRSVGAPHPLASSQSLPRCFPLCPPINAETVDNAINPSSSQTGAVQLSHVGYGLLHPGPGEVSGVGPLMISNHGNNCTTKFCIPNQVPPPTRARAQGRPSRANSPLP